MSTSPRLSAESGSTARPERRSSARRSVVDQQIVPVSLAGDNGGLVLDMSESGVAVQAVAGLQRGAVTELRFTLPEINARIHARGEVRWAEESGRAGIRILAFDEGSSNQIRMWMAQARRAVEVADAPVATTPVCAAPVVNPPVAAPMPAVAGVEQEIIVGGLDLDGALQCIAERTLQAARATGTAIALGSRDQMICHASAGAAPSLGVRLQADSGLSGECVRTGLLVRCNDTENDARVEAAVCRALDLRAAVLVPVYDGEQLRGVLEVFSNRPHAFGNHDLQRFRETAGLIATTTRRFAAATAAASVDLVAAPAAVPVVPAAAEPVAAPAQPPQPETVPEPAKAVTPGIPGVPAAAPRVRPATSAEPIFRAATIEPRRPALPAAKIAIAAVAMSAAVAGSWAVLHFRSVRVAPVSTHATTPSTQPAQSLPVVAQPSPEPMADSAAKPEPKPKETQKLAKPQPAPVVSEVSDSSIRPLQQVEPEVAPPQVTAAAASIPDFALPRMAAPSPSPSPAVARSSGVTPGHVISRVNPVYPQSARRLGIKGDVVLNAIVRENGTIGTIEVKQGNSILARAATEAVRQWRYQPYKLNGSPVEVAVTIRLHFSPGQ